MVIHNPILTGSFTVNGADLSTITGSVATSASFNARTTYLESTSSILTAASASQSVTSGSLVAASASLSATSGSLSAASGSLNTRVSALEATGSALSSSLLTVSGSGYATSASLSAASGSFNSRTTNLETYTTNWTAVSASFARTGSNTFSGNQIVTGSVNVTGSITATGTIIAQTLVVQTITSSVMYSSGSNVFGNSTANSHVFTGSMYITGSNMVVNVGTACFSGQICASTVVASTCLAVRAGSATVVVNNIAGAAANNHFAMQRNDAQYASIGLNGSDNFTIFGTSTSCARLTIDGSGNVGINCITPSYILDVNGTGRFTGALSGTSATFSGVVSTTSASSIGFLAQTTANSVHPYFRWVANNRSYWAAAIDSGTDATFKIGGGNTIGTSPFFTIDSGTNASTFTTTLAVTGAATFSSSVQAVSGIFKNSYYNTITEVGGSPYYGSALFLSGDAGSDQRTWRMTTKYAAPNVALVFEYSTSALSYGSNPTGLTYAEAMRFSPTGAATFSSSVTAGAFIPSYNTSYFGADGTISNYSATNYMYVNGTGGLRLKAEGVGYQKIVLEGGTSNDIWFTTSNTERMRITSGGITCFSSTICSPKISINTGIDCGTLNITGYDNGGINIIDTRTSTTGCFYSAITFRDYYLGESGAIRFYHNEYWGGGVNSLRFMLNGNEKLTLTNDSVACFKGTICAPTFRGGNFQSLTCTFAATSAGTNYDLTWPGSGRWLASVNTNSTYHWNGILALNFFDSADYSVNILTCGGYSTNAAFSIVGSGQVLRMCFSQNVGNVTVNYLNF